MNNISPLRIAIEKAMSGEDPLERMLQKTGCIDIHYLVQQCFFEHQDWRKCQTEVKQFKECMDIYRKKQEEEMNKEEELRKAKQKK